MGWLWSCQVCRIDGQNYSRAEDFIGGLFLYSNLKRWESTRNVSQLSPYAVTKQYNRLRKRFDEYERFKIENFELLKLSLEEIEEFFRIRIFIWIRGCKKSAPKCLRKSGRNGDWDVLNFLSERHDADYSRFIVFFS